VQKREEILVKMADAIEARQGEILKENNADVARAEETGVDDNLMQRLGLNPQKIKNLCAGIRSIADQSVPIRKVGLVDPPPPPRLTMHLHSSIYLRMRERDFYFKVPTSCCGYPPAMIG